MRSKPLYDCRPDTHKHATLVTAKLTDCDHRQASQPARDQHVWYEASLQHQLKVSIRKQKGIQLYATNKGGDERSDEAKRHKEPAAVSEIQTTVRFQTTRQERATLVTAGLTHCDDRQASQPARDQHVWYEASLQHQLNVSTRKQKRIQLSATD